MEYTLCKVSCEPDRSHATLWYANPQCVLEKPHKIIIFSNYQIDKLLKIVDDRFEDMPIDMNDIPIHMISDEFRTIHADYVEVPIGLHKHVSRKTTDGRPVYTRNVYVFIPLVYKNNLWLRLYDPREVAQQQINRYWIPVEED